MKQYKLITHYPSLSIPSKIRHSVWRKLFRFKFEKKVAAPIVFSINNGFLEIPDDKL